MYINLFNHNNIILSTKINIIFNGVYKYHTSRQWLDGLFLIKLGLGHISTYIGSAHHCTTSRIKYLRLRITLNFKVPIYEGVIYLLLVQLQNILLVNLGLITRAILCTFKCHLHQLKKVLYWVVPSALCILFGCVLPGRTRRILTRRFSIRQRWLQNCLVAQWAFCALF